MPLFEALPNPLAALCCNLQGDSVDVLFAIASMDSLYTVLKRFESDSSASENTTELSRLLNYTMALGGSPLADDEQLRGVKLCSVQKSIVTAFQTDHVKYVDSTTQCLQRTFDDVQQQDLFKGVKL